MLTLRPSDSRGHIQRGWLDARHSFAFGHWYPPDDLPFAGGFRSLRVINQDIFGPGGGFPAHPHRDMEIITYILSGTLAHDDNTGAKGTISRGQVQRMSAGSGIAHSEFNASRTEPVHLLQIWIEPSSEGINPSYEQGEVKTDPADTLPLIAGPRGSGAATTIHADARVFAGVLKSGSRIELALGAGRGAWVQVIAGTVQVNGTSLRAGDAAAIEGESFLILLAETEAEIVLFDLA